VSVEVSTKQTQLTHFTPSLGKSGFVMQVTRFVRLWRCRKGFQLTNVGQSSDLIQ